MHTRTLLIGVLAVGSLIGFASSAAEPPAQGWYPLRSRELPWKFEMSSDGPISVDSSSLENGVWKLQATLKEGQEAGKAWSIIGLMAWAKTPWEKSKLKIDLAQTPVLSFRTRFTHREGRNGKWWLNCTLGIVNENGKVINIAVNGVTPWAVRGEWVTRTADLNPFYLKFPRSRLVGFMWTLVCDSAQGAGAKVFRAEVADVMVRAQTVEEKMNAMRDPFLRQMRERKPLQTPYLTDRFWMGLWGGPHNPLFQSHEGTREVTGRDMIAHHVEVLIGMGCPGDWTFLETYKPQPSTEGRSTLDRYCEDLKSWLADLCRPFDLKVIPNISGIAEDADQDSKGFKTNMDGLMSAFAREPLIVGWDGAEEYDASRAREYLTAQFAIEDRNPHQPMAAFLGDINTLHRLIHVYYISSHPIRSDARKPQVVGNVLRAPWRYDPPAVWACLQGSAWGDMVMPTPAETRMMNHLSLAGGVGSISYWRYGGMLPYGGPVMDESLVDPVGNPSDCWTEYGRDAPVCIRMGATTCLMRRDEQASIALQKAQNPSSASLAYAVLRPRKLFASEMFPGANQYATQRLQQMTRSAVILVINTDTNATAKVKPDLSPVAGTSPFFTFPGGQSCPTTVLGRVRDPVEVVPGGIVGWLCGSLEQARAANLAGDRALYLNCVRLPRYDIVFAKRWKADVTAAEEWLAKADRAFAAGNYKDALDLQTRAETEVQRTLAAQPDYAAVTQILNEIKVRLGQMITRIRTARMEGRVKDTDPIAKGLGVAETFETLGKRYNRVLLPIWVKGGSPQLRYEVERLRREVLQLHADADRVLGPFRLSALAVAVPDLSIARPVISVPVTAPVVQPAPRPPEPPIASGGGNRINLLPLVDPQNDAIEGDWKLANDGLALERPKGIGVLKLPYVPPEEYDFEIEFTPQSDGKNVNQHLVAAGSSFAWKLNAYGQKPPIHGFDLLDDELARNRSEAVAHNPLMLEPGRRYTSKVEVRRGSLRALVNGEEYVRWSGDFNRLSLETLWRLPNNRHLALSTYNRGVVFHRIEVREVTGKGTFTRGTPASANK